MSEHILLAYSFDGDGNGESLFGNEIADAVKSTETLSWVHLDVSHPDTAGWLRDNTSYLDPVILDALLEEETRPRMTQFGDGIVLILRGVNLNENADPEDMISIRLWVDQHRIISVRKRKLKVITDIQEKIANGQAPKDAGDFVCMLSNGLFDRMAPVLAALDDATDNIEEKILENADTELRHAIVDVRKKAIMFRRYMAPQRDAISLLKQTTLEWISLRHKSQLQEANNHVTRYIEDLDAIRERAQIIKDELANIIADKLNRNMYVLSIVAAIFLPLGFLTGLLGINVGGIPGADNTDAFIIFCAILTVVVLIQVIVFKMKKWF